MQIPIKRDGTTIYVDIPDEQLEEGVVLQCGHTRIRWPGTGGRRRQRTRVETAFAEEGLHIRLDLGELPETHRLIDIGEFAAAAEVAASEVDDVGITLDDAESWGIRSVLEVD